MYNDMTNEDATALELLVDKHGLQRVVGTLACIAHEKADHILTSYDDKATSAVWRKACRALDTVCARLFV
jgi:hypothetical protein